MAHYNLGFLLQVVRKDYDGAERAYRKAIELDPECAMAHCNLGVLLEDVRKYDGAERHYRKAIELQPTALRYNNLGFLSEARKDYDGAKQMYRKAIELDPKYTPALWNLSLILENQKNDVAGAIELMEEVVRFGGVSGRDCEQQLANLRRKLEGSR